MQYHETVSAEFENRAATVKPALTGRSVDLAGPLPPNIREGKTTVVSIPKGI
jgi:hypothetical protein